jgi:hypothetical protein
MITRIEVVSPQGTYMTLSLEDSSSPFIVESMEGLDPVKATLVSSGFASLDGAQYQTSRRETRNITMRIGIKDDPSNPELSIRALRNQLYKFFMPKSQVQFQFYQGNFDIVKISGRVESFEAPLFTREPKIDVSIICFDPDFEDSSPSIKNSFTVSNATEELYEYEGTVETGFTFNLFVNRSLSSFTIYNRLPDNTSQTLEIISTLLVGDTVTISTVAGNKSVTRTRSDVTTSILYAMSAQSTWLKFFPGENHLRVYAVGAAIPYSLRYIARYGGL